MIRFEALIETASFATLIPNIGQLIESLTQLPMWPASSHGTSNSEKHIWGTRGDDVFLRAHPTVEQHAVACHGGEGSDTVDYSRNSEGAYTSFSANLDVGMSLSPRAPRRAAPAFPRRTSWAPAGTM